MKFVLLIQIIEILDNIFHSCLFIDAILKCSQARWHLLRLSFNSQMWKGFKCHSVTRCFLFYFLGFT